MREMTCAVRTAMHCQQEDPQQRLKKARALVPNALPQCEIPGSNLLTRTTVSHMHTEGRAHQEKVWQSVPLVRGLVPKGGLHKTLAKSIKAHGRLLLCETEKAALS